MRNERIRRESLRGLACLILLSAAWGCGRSPSAPDGSAPSGEKEKHELVLQPKAGWKPEDVPQKLKLLLISEKSSEVSGAKFRYRMEIQNVGREPVSFKEPAPSFINDGSLCGSSSFHFLVTPPKAAAQPAPCDAASKTEAGAALDVTLQPGEYLLTRPEGPEKRFRDLRTAFRFDQPGTYLVKASYDAGGVAAESNSVSFESFKLIKPGKAPDKLAPKSPNGNPPTNEKKHE